ncbi:MAG: GldG family protein [Gammaproteobacteria bacterium]|nr:GldG family protein [Gammaproteobacteria bacterium]
MKINASTHRKLSLQNTIFYILLIAVTTLFAQLSLNTNISSDWTANNRYSLSETTLTLLGQLDQTITIEAFVSPDNSQYYQALDSLLERYQRNSDKLKINIINPDFEPEKTRQLNIQQQGEMVVTLGDKQQHVFDLSEQSLTNALITVSRQHEPWLIFIEGHGERTPLNHANFNLSVWGENLKQKGFKLLGLNLVENSQIPSNTAAIVIASPEQAWLEGEIALIRDYITNGGSVIWLAEPNNNAQLDAIAEQLGLEFINGTVIDPNAEMLGITNPEFTLIIDYANHPVGLATKGVTLFPHATAIDVVNDDLSSWQYTPLLMTQDNAWSEAVATQDNNLLSLDEGLDTAGPLTLGYLITPKIDNAITSAKQQRIAVIGDGDFLSNTYIGNGSNLELGIALVNWVVGDDSLVEIPVKTTIDNTLDLSPTQSLIIGLGFLIALPLLLATIGFGLWWIRRKR